MTGKGKGCFMRFNRAAMILAVCGFGMGACALPSAQKAAVVAPHPAPQAQLVLSDTLDSGPPQWAVGDFWEYSDGYKVVVDEVRGGTAKLNRMDRTGLWTKRKSIFKQASKSSKIRRNVIFRSTDPNQLFPLALGKSVKFSREYTVDSGDKEVLRVHRTGWSVEGQETIEVPAGTFETWVLAWRTQSVKSEWQGYERWWYNPQIKHYVRMEYQYGDTPPASRVLTRYNVCNTACQYETVDLNPE